LLKIVSQLAILGENILQEDLNLKFLRSLPFEWNTHVVVWRNKPDLDTMSFDDHYNNFKIIKQEVKRTTSSSSSLNYQNMAFVSSPSSTNKVNTTYGVSTANSQANPASTQVSTTNLSDATVYTFLASKPNGKITINESDTAGYDKSKNQDSSRRTVNVEDTSSNAMVAIDGAGFDWSFIADDEVPTNMALMAFSDSQLDLFNSGLEEFQQPEFEGYGLKTSKSVSENISNEIKESPDALLVNELMSDDKLEKKTVVPTIAKVEVVRPKQQEKSVRKIVRPRPVNTARPNSTVVNAVRVNQINTVKASACWVWRPAKPNGASITLKRHNYIDVQGRSNGCSRHMTGNMSYLSDFKEFDGGYVTLGEEPKEGELLVKELLKLMCDKKNSVIFTDTGCFVLSPDFKLAFKSKVLLKVHRMNNMYSVDMKNIVPKESLTCLVAKATLDESML
nr:ribonuclease H-like domain-containing protein [Tanacetum cinerariifolium]